MKTAVYYGPGKMEIEDWPIPDVGDYDILIKTKVSLVCGTDVKTFKRGHPLFKPPTVLGHEFSGEVVAVGPKVSAAKPGDRVAVAPFISDGSCFYCDRGLGELCLSKSYLSNGSFSEYIKIDDEYATRGLVKLLPDVSWEAGAMIEPLACVVNAMLDLHLADGDTVAVVGAGPMGLLNALVARSMAKTQVVEVEMDLGRRSNASSLGFETIDPCADNPSQAIQDMTEGRGADKVILAAGSVKAVADAMALARPGGEVMLFGGFSQSETASIDPNLIHYKQVKLLGSSGFTPENFMYAGELVNNHVFDIAEVITHKFCLDDICKALDVASRTESLKVEISFC